jgi:crotonobetaine/carnitine-CoA ligase
MTSDVPAADTCVLRPLLEKSAAAQPDKVFVKLSKFEEITYRQMRDLAVAAAAGLHRLGVKQGDNVVVWMPNTIDCLRVWFGINWLGATYVPINTAYKGRLLEHVLANAGAKVVVAHASLAGLLADIDTATIETVVVFGAVPEITGLCCLPADVLDQGSGADVPDVDVNPWDTQSIIYTSGTTGPSKGVISSYAHLRAASGPEGFHMLSGEDRYMCNLPLYHVGGTIAVMAMLSRGGSIALVNGFSTEEFWPIVRETETTFVLLLGAMTNFLMKRPPSPDDRNHPLKKVVIAPLAEDTALFADRFGVEAYTLYNMTEISTPIVSGRNPSRAGSCGKARPGVTIRLVDEHDCEVEPGRVGELVVRTDAPWALNSGYCRNPEATAAAWRNGWFHTGDAFRQDKDGTYFFVDRVKDAIRRRGENISSFEVEAEIVAHPCVNEAAVVPVPSELSEEEVLCVVAPVPGHTIDPKDLIDFLIPRLPHFMVPRYVRIMSELPKTPTQKIQKHLLRTAGLTADTWDREAAGVRIRRQRLS